MTRRSMEELTPSQKKLIGIVQKLSRRGAKIPIGHLNLEARSEEKKISKLIEY